MSEWLVIILCRFVVVMCGYQHSAKTVAVFIGANGARLGLCQRHHSFDVEEASKLW